MQRKAGEGGMQTEALPGQQGRTWDAAGRVERESELFVNSSVKQWLCYFGNFF